MYSDCYTAILDLLARHRLGIVSKASNANTITHYLNASAEAVAQNIVKAMAAGRPVVYAPGKWALIMLVIRHLPRFLFNKADI